MHSSLRREKTPWRVQRRRSKLFQRQRRGTKLRLCCRLQCVIAHIFMSFNAHFFCFLRIWHVSMTVNSKDNTIRFINLTIILKQLKYRELCSNLFHYIICIICKPEIFFFLVPLFDLLSSEAVMSSLSFFFSLFSFESITIVFLFFRNTNSTKWQAHRRIYQMNQSSFSSVFNRMDWHSNKWRKCDWIDIEGILYWSLGINELMILKVSSIYFRKMFAMWTE